MLFVWDLILKGHVRIHGYAQGNLTDGFNLYFCQKFGLGSFAGCIFTESALATVVLMLFVGFYLGVHLPFHP